MFQRGVGRPSGGQAHHLGGDIRVPVAITADPRSGPQNRFVQQVRVGQRACSAVEASALTRGMTSKNAAG